MRRRFVIIIDVPQEASTRVLCEYIKERVGAEDRVNVKQVKFDPIPVVPLKMREEVI